jgi:hypothetical protein
MSSQIITKILGLIAAILLILMLTVVVLIQQPKAVADISLYFLKRHPSNVVIKDLKIEKIHWSSWNNVLLENVRLKCKIKGQSYFFSTGNLHIDDVKALFSKGPILLDLHHLVVVSDRLNVSDIEAQGKIFFHLFHYERLEAFIKTPRLEWGHYLIEDLQGRLKDEETHLEFSEVNGRLYSGSMKLQGNLDYTSKASYDFDIHLDHVNSTLMTEANSAFQQVSAIINGEVKIKQTKGVLSIQSNLDAPLGGSMKASLLRYLARYVPQRQQVEDLIQKDADVSLTKLHGRITSLSKDKLESEVILNSSSLNLNMDVKFSINVEGGIDRLFEYAHQ